jgi:hypothetical protein
MLSLWTLLFATLDLRGERAAKSAASLNRPTPDCGMTRHGRT